MSPKPDRFFAPQPKQGLPKPRGRRGRVKPRSDKRGQGSRVPPEVVEEVALRSGGQCECRPGCPRKAEHLHHRLPRSRGGRDDVETLIAVHHICHAHIHNHPEESYLNGTLLRSTRGDTDAA